MANEAEPEHGVSPGTLRKGRLVRTIITRQEVCAGVAIMTRVRRCGTARDRDIVRPRAKRLRWLGLFY